MSHGIYEICLMSHMTHICTYVTWFAYVKYVHIWRVRIMLHMCIHESCVTWLTYVVCAMSHLYVHAVYKTCHMCAYMSHVWHDSHMSYVPCHICTYMTYASHVTYVHIWVMCNMTHIRCMCHVTYVHTWCIRDMSHVCIYESCHTCEKGSSCTQMTHIRMLWLVYVHQGDL